MDLKDEEFMKAEDPYLWGFIVRVLNGEAGEKDYQTISVDIPERLAEEIGELVGFNVYEYGNEIDKGQTEHIWKEHGVAGRTDCSMADMRNLARVRYVVDNYEKIRAGKNRSKYKNSDGSVAKTIELQKKIADKFFYVVEAVPDTKTKKLRVISAYINRNDAFSEEAVLNNPSRYVRNEPQPNASFSD